jgi:hypothetical protein
MARKQGGNGLKGKYDGLIGAGMNASLMRMGDYASRGNLVDYADLMRKRAQAAYLRKAGKAMVRIPMTATQKKAKRAAAYKAKKAARGRVLSSFAYVPNTSSPMSAAEALDVMSARAAAAQFSPPTPVPPRITRASAVRSMALAAQAAARSKKRTIKPSNRRTRSMMPPHRSGRFS